MPIAFISCSHKDNNAVGLLQALLEFHGIVTWFSAIDIEGGQDFRDEIMKGLSKADLLIAVVSKHSAESKWVNSEIAIFQAENPKGRIVPLVLDSTDPNDVFDNLSRYQAIAYSVEGLRNLHRALGRSFLGAAELKRDRRTGERRRGDRRKGSDRRKWDLMRYRTGLWKFLERELDTDRHTTMLVSVRTLHEVAKTLLKEVQKYTYKDRRTLETREPAEVLSHAINLTWEELRGLPFLTQLAVTDTLAEQIWDSFEVVAIDRRSRPERRASDRRAIAAAASSGSIQPAVAKASR